MGAKGIKKVSKDLLRDVPGWKNAPVPICMHGDYRALAWCCKPGYSLTFGFKCMRDDVLKEIGLTSDEFQEIKEKFSRENDWDSDFPCFGSLSYCCMRRGGCSRRDITLKEKYPDKTFDEIYAIYASLKNKLANIILKAAKNQDLVRDLIDE